MPRYYYSSFHFQNLEGNAYTVTTASYPINLHTVYNWFVTIGSTELDIIIYWWTIHNQITIPPHGQQLTIRLYTFPPALTPLTIILLLLAPTHARTHYQSVFSFMITQTKLSGA